MLLEQLGTFVTHLPGKQFSNSQLFFTIEDVFPVVLSQH